MVAHVNRFLSSGAGLEKTLRLIQSLSQIAAVFTVGSTAVRFTAAKLQHLNLMPQGQAERWDRTVEMVETMEDYFGSCTNHRECEAAGPKSTSVDFIALMNRDYAKAQLKQRRLVGQHFP